jgi:hypothetical protein
VEKKGAKNNQKIQKLINDLQSGDVKKIGQALKLLKSEGSVAVLRPLAELLLISKDESIQQDIIAFLSDLNVSSAVDEIMNLLKDENLLSIRQPLLTTIWNCKLDYSYYLPEFVEIAVDGDFMETLECLTIIENMEGPFEERHILESQLHLKDYLEDSAPKDPQKAQIMSEIALIIKDYTDFDEEDIRLFNN